MNSIEQCIIERASHEQELKMTGIVSDEEIEKKELEAHYGFMTKIQEVLPAESSSTNTPLKQVQNNDEKNVFANERQHSEKKLTLKKLSERQLQIQQCKVQEVQSSVTSSGDETSSGIVSDEEIDKQELEAHSGFMVKIQEVLPAESSSTNTPLKQVQNNDEKNVFANERQHSEQPVSINNTCLVEKVDSNGNPDSSDMCDNENQAIQNAEESRGENSGPKCSTYNGRPTFANPRYLKKAQSEKPCLYEIPYDNSDHANRFAPDREETMTLANESRSKLNKDYIFQTYMIYFSKSVSKDVTCSYLHSLSDLNAYAELQCLYLHKVKECECLALKLSKQTESVNKEVHNKLLKSFDKLENHSISLELALQQCKEQMKNNSVCKENGSNVFRKEREQYHEIQDLKAQMQDKNIAISELKKLIEMFKRKGVDTNFEQPSILGKPPVQSIRNQPVVRQPTAYKSERYQCPQITVCPRQVDVSNKLTKPATPHSWHQMKESSLAKPNDLIAPGPSRNNPKHVSFQSPKEFVGSNDMVHNYYLEKAKKSAQLQKDKDVNGKPSMIDPARLPNTANGCKPKHRNWQASMSIRVSNKDVHLGEHRKHKPFLKFNGLQCPTCKKCLYSANHDECVLEYLSRNQCQNGFTKDEIFIKRRLNTAVQASVFIKRRLNTAVQASVYIKRRLIAADQASVFMVKTFDRSRSSIGLHADQASVFMVMMSDHNSSDLALQRQMVSAENNTSGPFRTRNSRPQQRSIKFKAGSKSCSSSSQDNYITTRVGITIPPSYSNAEDN
ncbi:hypothetical protein Tco_0963866, partial [Tanacetum coccineum]